MHDLIHIDGKPFVLVPMHEYRRMANGNNTENPALPDDVLDRVSAGTEHPVKILRQFRGMTQSNLAKAANLSRPYLTEIETRRKQGSIHALKALATALDVPTGILL